MIQRPSHKIEYKEQKAAALQSEQQQKRKAKTNRLRKRHKQQSSICLFYIGENSIGNAKTYAHSLMQRN